MVAGSQRTGERGEGSGAVGAEGADGASARLVAGAGRARETAAVLTALSALDAEGARRGEPLVAGMLADLEELLLVRRPPEGLLMLDSARVPDEDIGFVRRFLERHPGWRLIVLGADERDARVRTLLALARATFLGWPPDLAELRALLPPSPSAPAAPGTPGAPPDRRAPRTVAPAAAAPARGPTGTNGAIEVGGLVEELLASAALEGEDAPRYHYRAGAPFHVHRERSRLAEGLGGLVELARRCAGADGLVRAAIHPDGDRVRIGLDFPRGGLDEKDLPAVLGPANGGGELLAPARRAAALLRELGGEIELAPGEPGRLRCDVSLAAEAPAKRPGKPEDPFA
jgi:hypothetical protein